MAEKINAIRAECEAKARRRQGTDAVREVTVGYAPAPAGVPALVVGSSNGASSNQDKGAGGGGALTVGSQSAPGCDMQLQGDPDGKASLMVYIHGPTGVSKHPVMGLHRDYDPNPATGQWVIGASDDCGIDRALRGPASTVPWRCPGPGTKAFTIDLPEAYVKGAVKLTLDFTVEPYNLIHCSPILLGSSAP